MKRSIHIEAPVETVFDSVFDYVKDPAKMQDMMRVDVQVDDVKVTKEGAGTYYSWRWKIAGVPLQSGFDVLTDVVPGKHITDRSSNSMVGTWDFDVEAEGSGTKLTMEHHPQGFWRIPPLRGMTDVVRGRLSDSFMLRLKDTIETSAS